MQEPPEGDDDEVDDVGVEEPELRVVDVEGFMEAAEVSDVGWVGPVMTGASSLAMALRKEVSRVWFRPVTGSIRGSG